MSVIILKEANDVVLCPGGLVDAINADALILSVCEIVTINNGVDCALTFDTALTTGSNAALDELMNAWDNSLCNQPDPVNGNVDFDTGLLDGKVWMGDVNDVPQPTDVYTETEVDTLLTGYSPTSHAHEGIAIKATAVTDGFILTADGAGNAVWEASTGGASVFGAEQKTLESEGTSSTSSRSLQTKLTMTTPSLPSGKYRIGWYCEVQSDECEIEVQIARNGSTLAQPVLEGDDDEWVPITGFRHLSISGVQTITIKWRRADSDSDTVYIKRARLEIWRMS